MGLKKVLEEANDWEIIDVRELFEWNEGHIEGAKLMPMGEVVSREQEINWNKKVIFYCRSGNRSGQVAEYFSRQGKGPWNLVGGVLGL